MGARVWLKMDALQPSGSFKARGIGFACSRHAKDGCKKFVSSSGGNAGLAVAYSGRKLEIPVTVAVPEATSQRARDLIAAEGAEVIVHGKSWLEAHTFALGLVTNESKYIHPFDDPLVWEGHATIIDETLAEGVVPDLVAVAVGGGGLMCGLAHGLARAGLKNCRIAASETLGAESFYRAVQAGKLIELPEIKSIATTLGAKKVAQRALDLYKEFDVSANLVTDREAVDACLAFADDHRVIVEPACGAALALVYRNDPALRGAKEILMEVCGGAGVSYQQLVEFRAKLT